jgi:hypothetical protein
VDADGPSTQDMAPIHSDHVPQGGFFVSVRTYKSLRDSVHVQLMFKQPILDWTGISSRFFGMLYNALRGKLPINLSDFSLVTGTLVSDIRAKYSLYGGATSVALLADRLAFDFPNLLPPDYPVAIDVMATIHDALPKAFSEHIYDRIEFQSHKHVDLFNNEAVAEFLEQFETRGLESHFDVPVVQQPSCKFAVAAQDKSWQCSLTIEPSLLVSTALFLAITVSIRTASPLTPFFEKQTQVRELVHSLVGSVGLESADAS